jgi:hypothetical protein
VMVLALLTLSGTLLVAVSRMALRTAVAARSAEEDLQRRWGVASCRRAVLPYASAILVGVEQERRQATPSYSMSVRLGGQVFDLIVGDEQAKANVNGLLEGSDAMRVEARLRQALSGSGLANRIKVRATVGPVVARVPDPTAPPGAATRPVFSDNALSVGGLAQVFDGVPPAQLIRPMPGSRVAAAELLTCWGTGAVNVRRATDAALNLAAGRSLSTIDVNRLIEARNKLFEKRTGVTISEQSPAERLKEAMTRASGESIKNNGNLALIDGSNCYSLWVVSRNGRRDGYDLFVSDETDERRPVVWAFSW